MLLLMLVMILGGCGSGQKDDRAAIAVSFEPQAWILKQIAGDDFDIVTLIPSKSDPETYQPSVSTMKNLGQAKVYFTLGTPGFEESMGRSISSNFPNLMIEDAAEGITRIYGTHSDHSHDDGNEPSGFDPHMLTSIRNCIIMADNMTETLAELYPENEDRYREQNRRLKDELRALDDSISGLSLRDKSIVVRHPILSYFAHDYGIRQLSLETDGKEPSPMQIMKMTEEIKEADPVMMVADKSSTSDRDAETAKQLGLEMMEVSLNSADWLNNLRRIAHEIDRTR